MPVLPQTKYAERLFMRMTNASTAATATEKLGWTVPTGRKLRIDRVMYNNPTGLAADASNYFTIALKGVTSGTVYASWSTLSTAQGALTADTPVTLVLNATDANLVAAAGEFLQATYTKTGTQTLPAGCLTIDARLIS